MKKRQVILLALLSFAIMQTKAQNTLTADEKKAGWKLLFNGKDYTGWHAYGGKEPGSAWIIEQGAIKLNVPERAGNKAKNGGDIVINDDVKGDFEFKAEWKVSKFANSGIFFFVKEAPQYQFMHNTGLELQVIDDKIYEGAAENTHRASDFFGVANARLRESNPQGEWNQIHFIVKKGKLTVYQNGFMVQEHNLNGQEWKDKIAKSGLANAPIGKGNYTGKIGLQDWGSTVWYRNIKILKL